MRGPSANDGIVAAVGSDSAIDWVMVHYRWYEGGAFFTVRELGHLVFSHGIPGSYHVIFDVGAALDELALA